MEITFLLLLSMDEMQNTQTYFLSMFHKFGAKEDVIKQTLATHG